MSSYYTLNSMAPVWPNWNAAFLKSIHITKFVSVKKMSTFFPFKCCKSWIFFYNLGENNSSYSTFNILKYFENILKILPKTKENPFTFFTFLWISSLPDTSLLWSSSTADCVIDSTRRTCITGARKLYLLRAETLTFSQ